MAEKVDNGGRGGDPGDPGAGDSITITIGGEEKTLTPAEITTAMEKAGNAEQTIQSLSGFQKVLTQYGIGAEEYLKNSEASFALANSLIAQGIIDEQGNIVEKKPAEDDKPPIIPSIPGAVLDAGLTKQLDTISKALLTLGGKIETIEDGQSGLYRRNVERDVKVAHPGLDSGDVSKLLATAQADKSKSFWDHASALAQEKTAKEQVQTNTIAKATVEALVKAGIVSKDKIDVKDFDLNKLMEQDPSGGAPVYEGKKFMFASRKRRLGKDADGFVAPSDGMKEMLDQKLGD